MLNFIICFCFALYSISSIHATDLSDKENTEEVFARTSKRSSISASRGDGPLSPQSGEFRKKRQREGAETRSSDLGLSDFLPYAGSSSNTSSGAIGGQYSQPDPGAPRKPRFIRESENMGDTVRSLGTGFEIVAIVDGWQKLPQRVDPWSYQNGEYKLSLRDDRKIIICRATCTTTINNGIHPPYDSVINGFSVSYENVDILTKKGKPRKTKEKENETTFCSNLDKAKEVARRMAGSQYPKPVYQ